MIFPIGVLTTNKPLFLCVIKINHTSKIMAILISRQWLTALFIFLSINAFGQTIRGTVRDINNTPLQKVSIQLANKQHTTATDTSGEFSFTGLPAGKYVIRFSHTGFEADQKTITLSNGENPRGRCSDGTLYRTAADRRDHRP